MSVTLAQFRRSWSDESRRRKSEWMHAKHNSKPIVADGQLTDIDHGLSHLDRAPQRTFEECWHRARDPKRRVMRAEEWRYRRPDAYI